MTTQDLLNKLYGVNAIEVNDPLGITAITTTPQRFVDNDPGGLQLTVINTGANDIMIWTDASVSATKGIRLAGTGGSYEIDFTRFGNYPTREWWVASVTSTSTISTKRMVIA